VTTRWLEKHTERKRILKKAIGILCFVILIAILPGLVVWGAIQSGDWSMAAWAFGALLVGTILYFGASWGLDI